MGGGKQRALERDLDRTLPFKEQESNLEQTEVNVENMLRAGLASTWENGIGRTVEPRGYGDRWPLQE